MGGRRYGPDGQRQQRSLFLVPADMSTSCPWQEFEPAASGHNRADVQLQCESWTRFYSNRTMDFFLVPVSRQQHRQAQGSRPGTAHGRIPIRPE
jgi:hypothetical protein